MDSYLKRETECIKRLLFKKIASGERMSDEEIIAFIQQQVMVERKQPVDELIVSPADDGGWLLETDMDDGGE